MRFDKSVILKEIFNKDPGPGSYISDEAPSTADTVTRHIAFNSKFDDQRFKDDTEKLAVPGPCYYDPKKIEKRIPGFNIRAEP